MKLHYKLYRGKVLRRWIGECFDAAFGARADLLGDVLDAGTCCTHHEGHLAREDVDLVAKVHCTPFASDWGPYLDRRVLVDGEVFEDLRHVYQVQPPLGQGDDDRGRAVLPVLAVADEYVYAESDDVSVSGAKGPVGA